MKKRKYISLFHQFYKECVKAREIKKPLWPLLRFFPLYIVQNRRKFDRFSAGLPWLTKSAIDFLDSYIKPNQNVFEFGSGASTVYFVKNGLQVVSVEHDKIWFEKVNEFLFRKGLNNYSLNLIEPEDVWPKVPQVSSNKDSRFVDKDYFKYSTYISRFPDNSFDIVLIDGRVRTECLKNSISKVKKGGILIFDNSERKEYRTSIEDISLKIAISGYGFVEYDLGFTETSIFINS